MTGAGDHTVRVLIEPVEAEATCPDCGVISARVKDRPVRRVKDLPACGQSVQLWCRQRRLACRAPACGRGSSTPATAELPVRARLTGRMRAQVATCVAGSNRAVSDVAGEYVSWRRAHGA